jgi:hypothetical protein
MGNQKFMGLEASTRGVNEWLLAGEYLRCGVHIACGGTLAAGSGTLPRGGHTNEAR